MTSKKGSLWKTSWNRRRGIAPAPIAGDMAFFQDFRSSPLDNAFYATGVASTLAASLPFWFGVVAVRPPGDQKFNAAPSLDVRPSSSTDLININGDVLGAPGGSVLFDLSLGVAGDDYVCAALVMVTKDPSGTTFTVRVRLCDQVEQVYHGNAYVLPTFPMTISPSQLPGAIHGVCGGPGTLTNDEIRAWFKQLKTLLTIPPIPGKTTHLYSAGAVFPTVPAVLTNLGTDATQDMSLTTIGAPTPANVLIPVRFAY